MSPPPSWRAWVETELAGIGGAGQWRQPRDFDGFGPAGIVGGLRVVSFASNDYLGLSTHGPVLAAAADALERWGAGSGAARLIVGSRPVHSELEGELAGWKGTEGAVVFPTGFAANVGVLNVLGVPGVTILSDELNHASIIDGARSSRADVGVYRHLDVGHLAELMQSAPGRVVVVTDTVFSMDGDVAPLGAITELCAEMGALLVVDEAHAVLGPDVPAVDGLEVVRVGTLSKTLGSLGGFVAASRPVCDLIINRARSYIFTTAPTPADSAAALMALRVLRTDEGVELVARLRGHVDRMRVGWPSPIMPVIVGPEDETMAAAAKLLEKGLLVPAIRPPTVKPGTSRLRISLSAAHTTEQIERLQAALDELGLGGGADGPSGKRRVRVAT